MNRLGVTTALLATLCSSSCSGPSQYLRSSEGPWLTYGRTMCFGPCPAFTLEVDRDGAARFNGRAHVRHEGAHVAQWPTEFLETAARRAHAVDLAGHAGRYDNPMIMDLPAKTLSMGGHEIYDRYGAPDMGALYQTLDSLISLTDWQPAGH